MHQYNGVIIIPFNTHSFLFLYSVSSRERPWRQRALLSATIPGFLFERVRNTPVHYSYALDTTLERLAMKYVTSQSFLKRDKVKVLFAPINSQLVCFCNYFYVPSPRRRWFRRSWVTCTAACSAPWHPTQSHRWVSCAPVFLGKKIKLRLSVFYLVLFTRFSIQCLWEIESWDFSH